MYSKPSENVGIGVNPPTEKLDVDGNIKVSGEVNSPETGAANLLPIAYGIVNVSGNHISGFSASIISSTGNVNVTTTTSGVNGVLFNITVNNITNTNGWVPIVSLLSENGAWSQNPTNIYSAIVSNGIRVQLRIHKGDDQNASTIDTLPTAGRFSFVIYKI